MFKLCFFLASFAPQYSYDLNLQMMHIITFNVSIELKMFVKNLQQYHLHKKKKAQLCNFCYIKISTAFGHTVSCKTKSKYHSFFFDCILFLEGSLFPVKLETSAVCFLCLYSSNGNELFI